MRTDEFFMKRALVLANRGLGHVSPNPLVGGVLVKNDKIIGEGWHTHYGGEHAESMAINNCLKKGNSPKGSKLYVNLEPCCHYGKTPPCAKLIGESLVKDVIIGMRDPNPIVNGQGIAMLKSFDIKVVENVLNKQSLKLNESFVFFVKSKVPFVAMKSAISLNGKIGVHGKSVQISSKKSTKFSHYLRQKYDAILIGSKTALTDNPQLTNRHGKTRRNPLRIVLDPMARLSKSSKIFQDNNHLWCISDQCRMEKKYFGNLNVIKLDLQKNGIFNLKTLLKLLAKKNITSLLVEGGSLTFNHFINQKIPQIGYFIVSPMVIVEKNAISLYNENLEQKFSLKSTKIKIYGDDAIFENEFKFPS